MEISSVEMNDEIENYSAVCTKKTAAGIIPATVLIYRGLFISFCLSGR